MRVCVCVRARVQHAGSRGKWERCFFAPRASARGHERDVEFFNMVASTIDALLLNATRSLLAFYLSLPVSPFIYLSLSVQNTGSPSGTTITVAAETNIDITVVPVITDNTF